MPNESTAAGVTLGTYYWNGGNHQKFVLEGAPVNMVNAFYLKNLKSSLYLEAKDDKVVQNPKENNDAFVWQMVELKDSTEKPVSITKRKMQNKEMNESMPSRLFDALGRAAGQIRRGFSSRILKRE